MLQQTQYRVINKDMKIMWAEGEKGHNNIMKTYISDIENGLPKISLGFPKFLRGAQ